MDQTPIIVCRCEEITLDEIETTVKEYKCSSREVKLRTRAGMGPCGGRTCRKVIDAIVERTEGHVSDKNEVALSYRPPVRPVSFGILGGE